MFSARPTTNWIGLQYKSRYSIISKLTAGIKILKKWVFGWHLKACYCSKRLRKRVPNGRSIDTERSVPKLSPVILFFPTFFTDYLLFYFLWVLFVDDAVMCWAACVHCKCISVWSIRCQRHHGRSAHYLVHQQPILHCDVLQFCLFFYNNCNQIVEVFGQGWISMFVILQKLIVFQVPFQCFSTVDLAMGTSFGME